MKKSLSLILALVMLIGLLPLNAFAAETTESDTNPYKGKVISILGDSISTFAGYIPVADGFNLEHLARYPQDNLLTNVNETWWMQVITELDAKLGINDSWRGAMVSGASAVTTGSTGPNAAMSNLQRIRNLGANGTPDVILFYGGTNDYAHLSAIGTFDPATAPVEVDLTTTSWNNLADAYVQTLLRLRYYYPDAVIVAMLPTYTASYYSDTKLSQCNAVLAEICAHYGIPCLDLRNSGVTAAHLPDGIHPGAEGMDLITDAVVDLLLSQCNPEAGENVVHSVTHDLYDASASLGYFKGVTHGSVFSESLIGDDLDVTVTMGGKDITAQCYADGKIMISSVTGDLVITAKGKFNADGHLQMLPEELCCGTNLWSVLNHDKQYYTVDGWGTHNSGRVYSVTFPVSEKDRIYATSFGAGSVNGSGGTNGIRVTYFFEDGSIRSLSADTVYREFSANGYLTMPAGVLAVSVPMWTVSDSNELYILNRNHCYENGACAACGAAQWDTDGDGTLEILAIGNSFSVDALQYAYQIAQDLGIKEIVLGNLYIGGCSLNTHATNAAGDLAKYTYYYNDNGTWKTTSNYKISTALESRSWDFVSLQQASNYSGVESTYNKDLTNLIAYVQERSDAKLVWHMTWAYQQNSTHSAFPTYGKDQMTMYNAIVSAVQNKIVTNSNFDLIVPNGTAVQNSRTSSLGDTTTRDGYHMSYDYGRYLTGLLFIKTVTGLSVDSVTYAPSGVDAQEMAIAIESVNNAFAKPFKVTQSAYVKDEPEIPDEGYILLQPELYKGAYWHPIDVKNYNAPVADATNSKYYFATIRFTHETLPVGSIIILEDGWQYRPDGWITDTVQSSRADTTTESYVVVTEEWWDDYTIRGFNISKVGTPSIMNLSAEDIHKVFRIYVPEEKHSHDYTSVVTSPTCTEQGYTTHTCTLCGDSYVDDYMDATGHSFENGVCAVCGEIHYIELQPKLFQGAFWYPINADRYNELVYDMSNSYQYYATIRFTRETLPVGSIIVLKDGWQYRPDGWITDAVQTGTRAPVTTKSYVEVTEAWWGDYTIRGFNISKVGLPSMMDVSEEEVRAAFQILVPENSHIHNNENRICMLCGKIMGPVITQQPVDGEAKLGERYMVEVKAEGEGLKYQWYFRNAGTAQWYKSSVTDNTYDDVMTTARAGREVYCVITDANGNSVTTDIAKLIGVASEKLEIVTQPSNAEAMLGESFCVTVEARGEGLKYQWYYRNAGSNTWNKSGVRDNTYDDIMTTARAGREVYCVITDAYGNTVTTNTVKLIRAIEELVITKQPVDGEAKLGENYCVTVEAKGEGLKYQWYFRNAGTAQWYKSSVTDNTYDDVMTTARAGREVYCVITDKYGNSVTTDIVKLIRVPAKLEIITQPTDATAAFDEMFCATVEAKGEGLKYQWYYRNAGSDKWCTSGVRDNTYDDIMTKARNGREIYCVITDAYGNSVTTDIVKLIAVPSVELKVLGQSYESAAMGERYCVTVEAQGEGLTYQWYFRNEGSNTWYKSSVTDNTYDDVMTKSRANREVYCVITDAFGNQVVTEVVTLYVEKN